MAKNDGFNILKIQTVVLKVNLHCDGCKHKVKKVLHKVEGVYTVSIDADNNKVTITGNVNPETLIKKLVRSGKRAEFWSSSSSQKKPNNHHHQINKPNQQKQQQQHQNQQKQQNLPTIITNKDGNKNHTKVPQQQQQQQNLLKGLQPFKNQQGFSSDESDEFSDYDYDEDEDDGFDDLKFLTNKMNQMNLLKSGNQNTGHVKKNGNVGGAEGKKGGGNPILKNPNGLEQMGIKFGGNNKNQMAAGDGRRAVDMNAILGIPGNGMHHVHNQTQQQQKPNMFQSPIGFPSSNGGLGFGENNHNHHHHLHQRNQLQQQTTSPMMMNLQQQTTSPMMMNLQQQMVLNNINRQNQSHMMMNMQPQPQMMYHRAPQVPPHTGYCYPYQYQNPSPYQSSPFYSGDDYGAHLFSDENTQSCAVM